MHRLSARKVLLGQNVEAESRVAPRNRQTARAHVLLRDNEFSPVCRMIISKQSRAVT